MNSNSFSQGGQPSQAGESPASPNRPQQPHADVGFRESLSTWLLIGATGFGGPAGQIAILHREIVERKKWISEEEFLAALRLCMLLPGPEAQQLATYAGWRVGGLSGGLLAGTLFIIPGAILVTALAWLHVAGESWPIISAGFHGLQSAVVALVAMAAWRIGRKSVRSVGAGVLLVVSLCLLARGISFPVVLFVAAMVGVVFDVRGPKASGVHGKKNDHSQSNAEAKVFCEKIPTKEDAAVDRGARRWWIWPLSVVFVGVVLWLVTFAGIAFFDLAAGRGGEIAILFTETTLLSIGGAYAVVPWALEESLLRGWLEPSERFDALAMGEATPGPLILVVTFIGFVAGWRPLHSPVQGLWGAAIATVFAFIPSFVMVLGMAPFIQKLRSGSWLDRSLSAIGAAVVAAIILLNWKLGASAFVADGKPALLPIIMAIISVLMLSKKVVPTPIVVVASAAIGMLVHVMQASS